MQEQPPLIKYGRQLLVLIVVLLIVFVGRAIYLSATFRLIGTDPNINSLATVSPFFKVNFNKTLAKNVSVSVAPLDLMASYSVSGSTVTVLLNEPLTAGSLYSITVSNISDEKGKHLPNHSFVFRPQDLPESDLSAAQQQALLSIQERYTHVIDSNKLVQLLPFTGGGNEFQVSYSVTSIDQQPKLTIIITAPTQQGQEDGLTWIKEVGFNPVSYSINYVYGPVN
jgi:hypothetical protein